MKERQLTIYFCDHCNKLYQRKHACEKHERRCMSNPENERKCWSCKYRSIRRAYWCEDSYGHEVERSMDMSFCSKLSSFIHTPITEHKGNAIDLGDYYNVPMRKNCEFYKHEFDDAFVNASIKELFE